MGGYDIYVETLDEASVGFLIVEGERVVYASELCSRLSGYSVEELSALPSVSGLLVPKKEGSLLALLRRAPVGRGRVEHYEATISRKDGRRVDVDFSVEPLEGDGAWHVVVLRGATGHERMEDKIGFQARLLGAVGQAVVAVNLSGNITYWNRAAEALYGWSSDEVVGRLASEVLVGVGEKSRAAEIMAELRAGRNWSGEFVVRRKDGTLFSAMVTDTPVHDDRGRLIGIIGVSMDVTERKRSEELLRQQAAAMTASMDGVALLDEDGAYVYVNAAHASIFGYDDPSELYGRTWRVLYEEGELARLEREAEPAVRRDGRWRGEAVGKKRDGSTFLQEVSLSAVEGGGTVCVVRDVTERKQVEEALERSEERFRTVIEQSPMSIHIFLPDGRSLRTNESWNELWNLGEGEKLKGTNVFEDEQMRDVGLISYVHESIAELRPVSTPPLFYDPARTGREGSPRWLEAAVYPVKDEAGTISEMALVIGDVTERKKAEENLEKSEERFRSMVRNATDVFALVETDVTIRYISPSVERVLGYREDALVGAQILDYVHPDDRARVSASFAKNLASRGISPPEEFRVRHADGSWRVLEAVVNNLSDDPNVAGVVVNARDVTERTETEEALKKSEESFREAFENAPVGVALVGLDNRYLRVNRALCEMLGYSKEELLTKGSFEVTYHEDLAASAARTRQALENGAGIYNLEKRYVRADGGVVWTLSSVSLIENARGEPSHFVSLAQDITERKTLEKKLEHQAFHDALTGLPNRALFMDRLKQAEARMNRREAPVSVIFLDLDNFKLINDSLGHEIGDQLLVAVAERIKECVRPEDTVARLGGDEFTVLLEGIASPEDAKLAARRILSALRAPFTLGGRDVITGASIGIAPALQEKPGDLLHKADLALYQAKKKGRNGYEVYNAATSTDALEQLELENDLRRAVERGELEIHYHPKFSASTGKVVSMEALVRWKHPERGIMEPEEFLPIAEESGLILEIGGWVLKEVCRQGAAWYEGYPQRPPIRVCTNVSARELGQDDFAGRVAEALGETGLKAEVLSLEITDDVFRGDSETTISKLQELKNLGLHFVVQNFGVYHSSLARIKRLPQNYMKIDRSLVVGLEDGPESAAIVEATINIAHALGWAATAHGVETAEQLACLRKLGCDLVQGYYFSRPVVAEEATTLLEADFGSLGDRSS